MKILISSLVFYPDHSGIAVYASDFAFFCAEKGHKVSVLTGFPFYPQWKKKKEDEGILFRTDKIKGLNVNRGYIYIPKKITTIKRILSEISFLISTAINFIRVGKPDVIITFTTPVLLGYLSYLYKRLYKCKLIINVQDFQIEAAESLTLIKSLQISNFLKLMEEKSYKNADFVSSISPNMVSILKKKGVKKPILWPNWINLELESILPKKGIFKEKYNILNQKIIAYAGNIGEKQGLEFLIDISKEYEQNTSVLFLIIGEGAAQEKIISYHKKFNNQNVIFLPFLDAQTYKEFLSDVDLVFISQKKTKEDVYFPSKLLGIMAASKPILLSADSNSELYKVFEESQLGLVTNYGDLYKAKMYIDLYLDNDTNILDYQKNALEYVRSFDRENVLSKVLDLF